MLEQVVVLLSAQEGLHPGGLAGVNGRHELVVANPVEGENYHPRACRRAQAPRRWVHISLELPLSSLQE
jgi:hypothetical protein